jgi:release factor glutamine methyltransferase
MTAPQTMGATLSVVAAALSGAGFEEARRRARQVLAAALDLSPAEVFGRLDRVIAADEGARVDAMLRRALASEPLSRIRGRREFWGLELALSPDTLDPRPDSETLVEAVAARLPDGERPYRFLDLGTGSGCLLLALLKEFPRASGVGVDRAFGAARTARQNAERLGFAGRARFAVGDWATAIGGRFDAVVANPPYIASGAIARLPPEVRDFDPTLALNGGADGLAAYRSIAADLQPLLAPGGLFACEIGAGQAAAVGEIVGDHGLTLEAAVPDLAGIPRCLVARAAD